MHRLSLKSQILRAGSGSLFIQISHAIIGFTLAVTLARILGPDGYGIYSFALAILMLISIPAHVGLPQLVVRETAKAHSRKDWALMRGLWRWSNLTSVTFSAGVIIITIIFIFLVENGFESDRLLTLATGLLLIPALALAKIRAAALRGLRRVVIGQLPENIIRPALLLVTVSIIAVTLGTTSSMTPITVMTIHICSAMAAFTIGFILLKRSQPKELKSYASNFQQNYWAKATIPLALISGLQLINNQSDLIILGLFRADNDLGVYRAVFQISQLIIFGLQALTQVVQPYYAQLHVFYNKEKLQYLVTMSARAILVLAIPPVLIFIFYGNELLSLVFGDSYSRGGTALAILALGQLANSAMGSCGMLLTMTGHERDTLLAVSIAACTNIALNFTLIPPYGMEGAATSTALTLIVLNIIRFYLVKKRLMINSLAWYPIKNRSRT